MGDVGTFNFYLADNVCEVARSLTISRASITLVNNKAEHLVTEPGRKAAEAVVSDAAEMTSTDSGSFFAVHAAAGQPLLSLDASDCLEVADFTLGHRARGRRQPRLLLAVCQKTAGRMNGPEP